MGFKSRVEKARCDNFFINNPINLKRRLFIVLLMSSSFYFIVYHLILKDIPFEINSLFFLTSSFFIITEGVFLFDRLINKRYPWHLELRKRLILLFGFSFLWTLIFRWIMPFFEDVFFVHTISNPEVYNLSYAIGILYMIIYTSYTIALNYQNSLMFFMMENEQLKKDKVDNEYRQLKDQLNPHFLFNNMSALTAIIRNDQKTAIRFVENFTDVYRYVLDNEEKDVVTLKEELIFLKAYCNLHKVRIGEGISINFNIPDEVLSKKIPYLSLQILLENAIKHNITSKSKPLSITVSCPEGYIVVENNLQLKTSTYSTKTGLNNLTQRLSILANRKLIVEESEKSFKVSLPLIN